MDHEDDGERAWKADGTLLTNHENGRVQNREYFAKETHAWASVAMGIRCERQPSCECVLITLCSLSAFDNIHLYHPPTIGFSMYTMLPDHFFIKNLSTQGFFKNQSLEKVFSSFLFLHSR